jgi:hypothetical protein
MSSRQPGGPTKFDFYTFSHRITGEVHTGPKPLCDLLNDKSQSYLLAHDVYISRLSDPAEIGEHAPMAYLSKDNLAFVIVPLREVRAPDISRFAVQEYGALAILPGFEVQGKFFGPPRIGMRDFSPTTLDSFVILREATAQMLTMAKATLGGDAILVNRARLESFCLTE